MNRTPTIHSSEWTEDLEKAWKQNHPREALLADDIAKELNDPTGLRFYRWAALRFAEPFLRQIASYVSHIPKENVRSSRGAVFCKILKGGGVSQYRPRGLDSEEDGDTPQK